MDKISLVNIRPAEHTDLILNKLKQKIETELNLTRYSEGIKSVFLTNNLVQRISFMVGLSLTYNRNIDFLEEYKLTANHFHDTVFSRNNLSDLYSALLKLRYNNYEIDWNNTSIKSKIINHEMINGANYLLKENKLDEYLFYSPSNGVIRNYNDIPELNLYIGNYEGEIPAYLNMNGKDVTNTQIIIAGATGSGKSNLLAVLINQLRSSSIETAFPVNFLLFDYKGEFSDPLNIAWLNLFEVDEGCILNPMTNPLPFNPFKDFTNKSQNEINLYATELASALCSLDNVKISANMSNRLSEAVINAYKKTHFKPVTFNSIFIEYTALQSPKDADKMDSVKSVLNQLIRSNLFTSTDSADLIKNSYIIKMDGFPKDGILAKAIVYFTVSKLNTIYEVLPKQESNENFVELRHFTIIDEAHYMLEFDNRPLRELIAIGRNKGMSIILATQNMDSFKSTYFDFYANAQYPLILKQQSINDKVIKDLFGVSGNEFNEIKEAIASLKKGELIIKNNTAVQLGLGKKYKRIKVSHLI